jgi:hypothetical protein
LKPHPSPLAIDKLDACLLTQLLWSLRKGQAVVVKACFRLKP